MSPKTKRWHKGLVRHFSHENTLSWRARASIRSKIEKIKESAEEAETCLTKEYDLPRAALCLDEIEEAFKALEQLKKRP